MWLRILCFCINIISCFCLLVIQPKHIICFIQIHPRFEMKGVSEYGREEEEEKERERERAQDKLCNGAVALSLNRSHISIEVH